MKTTYLLTALLFLIVSKIFSQQRYFDEVFTDVNITSNIQYGENYTILSGAPVLQQLMMDVYEPAGDTAQTRPVVVYMHAGDFLPVLAADPYGDRHDSCAAEICKRLARHGFVAVSIDYRIGWLPFTSDQDVRTGTLIQAVYRGLQDAKTCVRFLKMNSVLQGNTYRVDTDCIIVGGEGSAGYISTAYASLNKPEELNLLKFLSTTDNADFGFVTGQSYIQSSLLGDLEGFGGTPGLNNPNWPGYSSKISMVFNLEGALGDSSWMEAGEVPMVSFHDVNNPGSPYTNGGVIGPAGFVIWVTGSHDMIRIANQLGNNDPFHITWTDPYSVRANQVNEGWEGLFPIIQPPAAAGGQANPWQWWDSLALIQYAIAIGFPTAQATAVHQMGLYTNPDMSKEKAMRYIDTVMGYLTPRIVQACQLPGFVGIGEATSVKEDVGLFPNPVQNLVHLKLNDPSTHLLSVKIYDIQGKLVFERENVMVGEIEIPCNQLGTGLFTVQVLSEKGLGSGKLIVQ